MAHELSQYILIIFTGALVYGVYVVGSFLMRVRRIGKAVNRFPGNPKHWFWGHLHEFPTTTEEMLKYFDSLVEKYPRACNFWVGGFLRPSLIVHHPETVKPILKTSDPKPLKFGMYKYGVSWLGESLEIASGARWFRNRKLLTPIFYFGPLKEYLKIKNLATDIFIENLSIPSQTSESVNMLERVSLLANDIILRCAFSTESDVQTKKEIPPFYRVVNELLRLWYVRCFRPWMYFDFIYSLTNDGKLFKKYTKCTHEITEKIINDRRKKLENPDYEPPQDFLNTLMLARDEDGLGLTNEEIRSEVITFYVGGNDTTANTVSWTMLSLAENPDCQKLCQEEIDAVFAGRPMEADVQWEDLQELNYLTMCIKEASRLYSIVPMTERQLESPLEIDGTVLPAGTVITILLYNLHHNPTVWEEPMKYNPERFSQDNMDNKDHFVSIPFSAGSRNCIGQNFAMNEMKVILCKALRRYNLSTNPEKKAEREMGIMMTVKNGIHLKVSQR